MCTNAGTFCCTCVQIHLADLQIILALLGSLEFDLKPTAKRGNPFITMAPLDNYILLHVLGENWAFAPLNLALSGFEP